MNVKNIFTLLKILNFRYLFIFVFLIVSNPYSHLQAQNPDEEGEIFWDDDEEFEDEEDEFDEDDEYLDDEDYYDDDEEFEEDYEDEYENDDEYEDSEEYEDDSEYDDIDVSENQAERSGWSVDISGAAARLVNYTLWKEYGLNESSWEPSMQGKVSIEAPYMLQLLGLRFRVGAEVGTFGFIDLTPRAAELKGVSAAILAAIPAGPGKIKIGTGIFGKSMGFMFEATYGIAIGSLDIRFGLRSTELMTAVDSKNRDLGHLGWMDGVMALGINF